MEQAQGRIGGEGEGNQIFPRLESNRERRWLEIAAYGPLVRTQTPRPTFLGSSLVPIVETVL